MKKTLLRPRQILLILVALLLVGSFLPGRWAGSISYQPRHFVNAATRPITYPLKLLSDSIRQPAELTIDESDRAILREQYGVALATIRRLERQLEEAQQETATLSQVREHLGLSGVQLYPASVIAWSGDPIQPSLTINRGSRHRLRVGLVVASGFNLVGRISSVGPVTSTARLISSPDTQLTLKILPPLPDAPPRRMLIQARSDKRGEQFVAQTDVDDPVQVGDLAHLADDLWPLEASGLVVGKVVAIEKDPDDPILRRLTQIEPIRSFAHLDRVVVQIPSEGEPIPGEEPRVTLEPNDDEH